ncbi:MAG: type VI secretion system baseplate subunit TssF [Alphaproteobacteria bacterium]|nr:type VI secretion system baseplate subunit TssF [Alphaproteobacteria bacterium]
MIRSEIDTLSEYYRHELAYLRSSGEDFAKHFPKIARRLDLSHEESSDPHVERLIESFAFLTGKLQKQIDDQYPEIANALLGVIYKPLILPIPSSVMVNFDIDLSRAKKNVGMVVPRHSVLRATSHDGTICTFRTTHDMKIWPIELKQAEIVSKESLEKYYTKASTFLKLHFSCAEEGISPDKLRFYILADALLRGRIFAGIFSSEEPVILEQSGVYKNLDKISPVGLEDDEALLIYPDNVNKGFRYLQEYFAFPDKFYGFDVPINENLSENFTLYIPIGTEIQMKISKRDFSLSTVPAVNLFSRITEPLRLDYKQVEYQLVPDYRLYKSHEIYTIEKMVEIEPVTNDEIEIPEFYSCNHFSSESKLGMAWIARRKESMLKNSMGDDIYVSFVDENFNPQQPIDRVFYAYTLCTNRHAAEDIPVKGQLQAEISLPVKQIYCANRPTLQKNSMKNGAVLWKLISLVSLNSLSFSNHGIVKLKEILRLFSDMTNSSLEREIDSILEITSNIGAKRVARQSWYGFVNGTNIEINFDDNLYNKGLPLSMVISKFLSCYTTINTFADVCVKSQSGMLRKWETQFGSKNYL